MENQHIDSGAPLFVAHTLRGEGFDASEDGSGRGTPLVPVRTGYQGDALVTADMAWPALSAQGGNNGGGAGAILVVAQDSTPVVGGDVSPALKIGTGLDIGQPPIVAFSAKDNGRDATEDIAPTLRAMPHGDSHANGGVALNEGDRWIVRRLTPRECERLQGFPQVSEKVIFSAWLEDRLQPHVAAEIQCTTGQSNALSADADAALQFVKNAGQSSNTSQAAPVPPVVLHVLLDCEREVVEIRSAERLIWSASTAERSSASPLSMPPAVFARLVALTTQAAEKTIPDGRVASHRNTARSTHLWSGARSVNLSGQEIGAHADAVAACISDPLKHSTFTISPSIASIPTSALTLTTLCCSVLTAIGSFIPETIQRETSFSLLIETRLGFTAIPYHNKPAANCPDGPRYKAIGNSMAVNVMRWIGERIDLFERLMRK